MTETSPENNISRLSSSSKRGIIAVIIVAVIVLLVIVPIVNTKNSLATSKQSVDKAWSQVEVAYQRRADLIPNLVNIAQQASVREETIITAAIDARSEALNGSVTEGDTTGITEEQAPVSSALTSLLALSESYPELQSNDNWRDLQSQVEGSENRISVARADYNDAVEKYNNKVVSYPDSIIASMLGYEELEYFHSDDGTDKAPSITFDDSE